MLCASSKACSRPNSQACPETRAIRLFERAVLAAAVQIALELGDVSLFAVVAAHLVEDLDEDGEQGVELLSC